MGFDLHRDFAGAVGFIVFDGGRRGCLEDLGKAGENLVVLESEVAHGGVAIDLDAHHATSKAAVGIHLGGALGHDFLMSLGAGNGSIAHDIDDLVVGGAIGFCVVGGGNQRAVLKALAFDDAVERVDDLANLDGADDLDTAVGQVFGGLGGNGADERCRNGASNFVIARSQVLHGGLGIDLEPIDALGEKTVGVKLCGPRGLEPLARAGLDPNLRKNRSLFFGGFNGGV